MADTTTKEAGHRGGTTTVARYSKEERSQWNIKGGQTTKERYGVEHYRAIQRKGVETKLKKKQAQSDLLTSKI